MLHVRRRLISISLCPLCLLLTIHTVHTAVTHPSTHRAQRDTTSALLVDQRQNASANVDFTDDADVPNLNSLDFQKTNEAAAINATARATTVGDADFRLVSIATEENGDLSLVGQQVPDHVTSLTYLYPTSNSPSHMTNTAGESTTTEAGSSFKNPLPSVDYDDVIVTSSHGVRSNNETSATSRLLEELASKVSEGTSAWESWTTHVEPDALQYTAHGGNDSSSRLITSSMTSLNHTAGHHTRALIDSGESGSCLNIICNSGVSINSSFYPARMCFLAL